MICNKAPGIDGLTSEFSEAFWYEFKTTLLLSYKKKIVHRIKHFKKQAVIELIEKKDINN